MLIGRAGIKLAKAMTMARLGGTDDAAAPHSGHYPHPRAVHFGRVTRRSVLTAAVTSAAAVLCRSLLARQSSPSFRGNKAGESRAVDGVKLCW